MHNFVEGGQTWAHRVRMMHQVVKLILGISLAIASLTGLCLLLRLNPIWVQSGWYYAKASLLEPFRKEISVSSHFWADVAHERNPSSSTSAPILQVLTYTRSYLPLLKQAGIHIAWCALLSGLLSVLALLIFFYVRGKASKRTRHLSGKRVTTPSLLKLNLHLKRKASAFSIAGVPLVKDSETQHLLITGGTGSGKTNCMHHLLPQIREQQQRALILDTSGLLVEKYYRPGEDRLLNPFDGRSLPWHPWIECLCPFDYDHLAESFIPQSHHEYENYWRTAARSLLSSALQKLSLSKSSSELAQKLLFRPLHELAGFVADTKAAAHIDLQSEKTAASIRSVASSFLACLEYVQDTSEPFSIRQWVQKGTDWLFLGATPEQRATLNPLLSCWFSVAVSSLMRLNPDFKRRLWFVIDELPSLNKLKSLETLVTETRKYGGCALLSLQSPFQLEAIYGHAVAHTILGNCATRLVFAEHNPLTAESLSKSLGETDLERPQESISYGSRDSVSLSHHTQRRPLISSTDIQSLPPNTAYLKLPGNLPIAKIQLPFLAQG